MVADVRPSCEVLSRTRVARKHPTKPCRLAVSTYLSVHDDSANMTARNKDTTLQVFLFCYEDSSERLDTDFMLL